MITALTRYGVKIAKTFPDTKSALHWAEHEGARFGCVRIVRETPRGPRTIWRPSVEVQREAA